MPKSTAKAESLARDLKDRLVKRGYAVAESKDAEGWPKLTLNTDEASIRFEGVDAVSKDIFGNATTAYAPHFCDLAVTTDNINYPQMAELTTEIAKTAVDKMFVKTNADTLATAEEATGTLVQWDIRWPTKGT
jgi:hypothetical protein